MIASQIYSEFTDRYDVSESIHTEPFNVFLSQDIHDIFEHSQKLYYKQDGENHQIRFTNAQVGLPHIEDPKTGDLYMCTPIDAQQERRTYGSNVYVDIIDCIVDASGNELKREVLKERFHIVTVPVMQRSSHCVFDHAGFDLRTDLGGIFWASGKGKILPPMKRLLWNCIVEMRSKSKHLAEIDIRSIHEKKQAHSTATMRCFYACLNRNKLLGMENCTAYATLPYMSKPVPITVLLMALGWDLASIRYAIRSAARKRWFPEMKDMINGLICTCPVKTTEEAFDYLQKSLAKTPTTKSNLGSSPVAASTDTDTKSVNAMQESDDEQEKVEEEEEEDAQVAKRRAKRQNKRNAKKRRKTMKADPKSKQKRKRDVASDEEEEEASDEEKEEDTEDEQRDSDADNEDNTDHDDDEEEQEDEKKESKESKKDPNEFIQNFQDEQKVKEEQRKYIRRYLDTQVLTQYEPGEDSKKGHDLARIIHLLFLLALKKTKPTNVDDFHKRRYDSAGHLSAGLLRQILSSKFRPWQNMLNKCLEEQKPIVIDRIINEKQITTQMEACFRSGTFAGTSARKVKTRENVVQSLIHINPDGLISHLSRLNSTLTPNGKHHTARALDPTQYGRVCPSKTPEGKQCGLLGYLAYLTHLSLGSSTRLLILIIKAYKKQLGLIELEEWSHYVTTSQNSGYFDDFTQVVVDGVWIGWVKKPHITVLFIQTMRRTQSIDTDTSVYHDEEADRLDILTDRGRVMRRLLRREVFQIENKHEQPPIQYVTVSGMKSYTKQEIAQFALEEMEYGGLYESIDASEERMLNVAFEETTLNPYHTHMEVSPSLQFGNDASKIPFPHHDQAPRVTYQTAMGNQAVTQTIDGYTQQKLRHDLAYPQLPLVSTRVGESFEECIQATVQNPNICVAPFYGYNQDDAVVINKAYVQRAALNSSMTKTYEEYQNKPGTGTSREIFEKPDKRSCRGMRDADYSGLQANGIPAVGRIVFPKKSIIMGKTTSIRNNGGAIDKTTGRFKRQDASILHTGEMGVVIESIALKTRSGTEYRKVVVLSIRIPQLGDKFSSKHGQKNTAAIFANEEEMYWNPYTQCIMDVVVPPGGMAGRMTVGQLMESLHAKARVVSDEHYKPDGTAFGGAKYQDAANILHKQGFKWSGTERLCLGQTGEMIECDLYVGMPGYQRLKHMPIDKNQARGTGPRQVSTRQPSEGRDREGGQRFGEMERDCLISHGASKFLKEKTTTCSDGRGFPICTQCGHDVPNVNFVKKTAMCDLCKTGEFVGWIEETSNAWMLVNRQNAAMGIRIKQKAQFVTPRRTVTQKTRSKIIV